MQTYAMKFHNFLRFGEKNNTIVFDLSESQKKEMANGSLKMDDVYAQVSSDPERHITEVQERGLERQIGIVGLVDGNKSSSNGVGKSSIMEGICYSHYERIVRRSANTDKIEKAGLSVVTKVDGKYPKGMRESYVEEYLEDNGSIYRIKRGRAFSKNQKSNTPILEFDCIKEGDVESQKSHRTSDTKKSISDVITMDYDIFVNTQMFGQGDAGKYLMGTDKTKKAMLISMLNLDNLVVGCLESVRSRKNNQDKKVDSIKSKMSFMESDFEKAYHKYLRNDDDEKERLSFSKEMPQLILKGLRNGQSKGKEKLLKLNEKKEKLTKQIEILSNDERLRNVEEIKKVGKEARESKLEKESEKDQKIKEWEERKEEIILEKNVISEDISRKEKKLKENRQSLETAKSKVNSFNKSEYDEKLEKIKRAKTLEPKLKESLNAAQEEIKSLNNSIYASQIDIGKLEKENKDLQLQIDNVKDGDEFICEKCKSKVEKEHILSEIGRNKKTALDIDNDRKSKLEAQNKLTIEFEKIKSKIEKIEKYKLEESKLLGEIKTHEALSDNITTIDGNGKELTKEIEAFNARLKEGDRKTIDHDKKYKEISLSFDKQFKQIEDKINSLRSDYAKAKELAKEVETEVEEKKELLQKLDDAKGNINEKMGILVREIEHFSELSATYEKTRIEYEESVKLLHRYLILESVYGLDGIQTRIIKKYLPLLNVHIKDYLDILSEGTISVKMLISEKSKIDMVISGASADTYEMLSGGEKMIVRLAVDIGMALLSFSRSAQKPEMIFLDEIFGCLDENRKDKVFEMLEKLKDKFSRVVIISHDKEICDRIPATIVINKRAGSLGLSEIKRIE